MGCRINMEGQRFGRLVVVCMTGTYQGHAQWECRCDCGGTTVAVGKTLRSGGKSSCGCLRREVVKNRMTTHGQSCTRTYNIWNRMRRRCIVDPNYAGRGIVVCDRWLSFENFLADMGEAPEGASIERMNNSGNYEPHNCKWATRYEQSRNKRNNLWITHNGQTKTATDWSLATGINRTTIVWRHKNGWPTEKIFGRPAPVDRHSQTITR